MRLDGECLWVDRITRPWSHVGLILHLALEYFIGYGREFL